MICCDFFAHDFHDNCLITPSSFADEIQAGDMAKAMASALKSTSSVSKVRSTKNQSSRSKMNTSLPSFWRFRFG